MLCIDYGYKLAQTPADLTRPQINFLMAALANRIEKMTESRTSEPGVTRLVFVDDEELSTEEQNTSFSTSGENN